MWNWGGAVKRRQRVRGVALAHCAASSGAAGCRCGRPAFPMTMETAVEGRPRTQRTTVWFVPGDVPFRVKSTPWRPERCNAASLPSKAADDVKTVAPERARPIHPPLQSADDVQVRPSLLAQTMVPRSRHTAMLRAFWRVSSRSSAAARRRWRAMASLRAGRARLPTRAETARTTSTSAKVNPRRRRRGMIRHGEHGLPPSGAAGGPANRCPTSRRVGVSALNSASEPAYPVV